MTDSRIESSQHYVNRFREVKCANFVKIFSFVIICLSVSAQIIVMFFLWFGWLSLNSFFVTVNVCTGIVIAGLNVNMTGVYFKLNGLPYKSNAHFAKVRSVGIVCGIWTVAFVIKLVAVKYSAGFLAV